MTPNDHQRREWRTLNLPIFFFDFLILYVLFNANAATSPLDLYIEGYNTSQPTYSLLGANFKMTNKY